MDAVVLKSVVALAPVLACLGVFIFLDAFKLMSLKEVLTLVAGGGALAAVSYLANWRAMDELPIGFTNYSKYAAPVVEETAKAALILALFWRNRIGYVIDAAIAGFAVGAGFSLVENLFYLYNFSGANLGVWLVRGFGTAVLHGGATAIFAALGQLLNERRLKVEASAYRFNPLLFAPGLAAAIVMHSAYNHLPDQPLLAMAVTVLVVPLTLMMLFALSQQSAHRWLASDHEAHARLLADIESGAFGRSEDGRALAALAERLGDQAARDLSDYVRIHTWLVVQAESALIRHQNGERVVLEAEVRDSFKRLHALERRLGPTALYAVQAHLKFSRNDLWEMHELEEDA